MTEELYPGQADIVAGKLAEDEMRHRADKELLENTTDPSKRQEIMRRIAGREGSLSTRRRFLQQLTGETDPGAREKKTHVRWTDEEYEIITKAAEESGLLRGQFIRKCVLDVALHEEKDSYVEDADIPV